jgi:hypothetical protein
VSFFHACADGGISGAATRKHPFFVTGAVSALDTFGIQSLYSRVNSLMCFPLATTLERWALRNNVDPTNDVVCELYQGGSGGATGDILTLGTADFDEEADLSPVVAVAPTVAAEVNTTAIELDAAAALFANVTLRNAIKYVVPSNTALSWLMGGWVVALGNNAEEFIGINGNDVVTSESTRQSPWARSGTLKTLMVIPVFQNGGSDKTYTLALRKNGADIISVNFTNVTAGSAGVQLLFETDTEVAVAAGDFLNWRISMSGGFSIQRAVQFLAVVGYEDDN